MVSYDPTISGLTAINVKDALDEINTGAKALKSATTDVNVSSATAPTTGQVLTATSATTATWQTPSGGTFSGCKLIQSTAQTVGSMPSYTAINWDTELFDTSNYHDNAVNNTRITIPSD